MYRALVSLLEGQDVEDVKWLFSCWLHIWYQLVCTTQLRRTLISSACRGEAVCSCQLQAASGIDGCEAGLQLSPPGQTFLSQHPYWIRTHNLLIPISRWAPGPNLQCIPSSVQVRRLPLNFCIHMLIVFGFALENGALKMICILLCDILLAA